MAKDVMDEQDAPQDGLPNAGDTASPSGSQDFAATLAELETLVARLESGDLTLEQSLGAFERGVRLTRDAQQRLDSAELKVRALLEQADGRLEDVPFAASEDNSEDHGRGPLR